MDDQMLWQPKRGDLVRLKKPNEIGSTETARIEVVGLQFQNYFDKTAIMLDMPLDGCRYWNRDDLEPVRTRITIQLPIEAAEKILADEDEFVRFLRANGIPIEVLVNVTINDKTVYNGKEGSDV